MDEKAIFSYAVLYDNNIKFISFVIRPLRQCLLVKEYLSNPKNKGKYLEIPFINIITNDSFEDLSIFTTIDNNPDNIQRLEQRCPYYGLIDEYVAKFIYDHILEMIENEKNNT